MTFMQDNAPVHTAFLVQDWLRDWASSNGVQLLEWPPYSPDINPIENLWKLLKENILKNHPELSSLPMTMASFDSLERAAVEAWEDFPEEMLNHLIDTMPHRIEALIAADGWYTKY